MNRYQDPTLRELFDASKEAASGPGRYCSRMAYIIDVGCDPLGDDTFSAGLGGSYYTRFGRRILIFTNEGFVQTGTYPRVEYAEQAMEDLRNKFAADEDWEI